MPTQQDQQALTSAMLQILEDAARWDHNFCKLGNEYRMNRLNNEPGTVPAGVTRAVVQHLRKEGFRTRLHDLPGNAQGVTTGWVPPAETRGPLPPWADQDGFLVQVKPSLSPVTKFEVLLHEAGHVMLGHAPRSARDVIKHALEQRFGAGSRITHEKSGLSEDLEQEVACELASATIARTMGLSVDRSLDYLAHRFEAVNTRSVAEAARQVKMLWPVVAAALN